MNGILADFNSISVISRLTLCLSFLGFTSTRLGSEVSCPRTLPRKNPEDPVRLKPWTPGLRVKHFTTEPREEEGEGEEEKTNNNNDNNKEEEEEEEEEEEGYGRGG